MNFERPANGFRNDENGSLKTDMDLERPGVNLKMPRSVSSNAKKRSLKKRVDLERSEIEAENGCRRPGLHLGVALEKLELNLERPWSGQKSILNSEVKKSSI